MTISCLRVTLLVLLAATSRDARLDDGVPAWQQINHQGEQCAGAIGVIEPFNCLDGELVPIGVDGVAWKAGDPYPTECDNPSWLGADNPAWCHPNARVGRLPSLGPDGEPDDDIQNLFICRRYSNAEASDPCFEDVAIIQHRRSTGDTCFFQHAPPGADQPILERRGLACLEGSGPKRNYQRIDARRVPPPTETAERTRRECPDCPTAEEFWMPPGATAKLGCPRCHASGPFIRSPYITQVTFEKDGHRQPVVFPLSSNAANNYRFVGEAFTSQWHSPEYIADLNYCTSCHVMGTGALNFRLVALSVGYRTPPEGMPDICSIFYPPFSETARQYPDSHWMPPAGTGGHLSQQKWDELYAQSVKELMACLPTLKPDGQPVDLARCLPPGVAGQSAPPQSCNVRPFGTGSPSR